ncbi:Transcriptional regulatory protein sin3, partial [Gonapodya sp. JEL0774]
DALMYLDDVKREFQHEPVMYERFLDIMKEFKAMRIDTPGVIDRVCHLFRSRLNLLLGFNQFLPPGYHIEPSPSAFSEVKVSMPSGVMMVSGNDTVVSGMNNKMSPHLEFNNAINYIGRVKKHFKSEPDRYLQFLQILEAHQKEQRPVQQVYKEVMVLFHDAPELFEDFKKFLPDNLQLQTLDEYPSEQTTAASTTYITQAPPELETSNLTGAPLNTDGASEPSAVEMRSFDVLFKALL